MESYIVKFWTDKDHMGNLCGYREQKTETVNNIKGKNNHKAAGNIIKKKYGISDEDIVSITYV